MLGLKCFMSTFNGSMSHTLGLVLTLGLLCGLDATSSVAGDGKGTGTSEPPKHFILNPDERRPVTYPAEISIKQLEEFLKAQRLTGQGCGGMNWEGTFCGMFCNDYEVAKTPWLKEQVELNACYAQTKTGTFLASFMLGQNRYDRDDRSKDKLTWAHNYGPEVELPAIGEVLLGNDSTKRKELLIKIKDSFQNLDLQQFPKKRRELLALQLKQCENDKDAFVVTLAQELGKALTPTEPQR